MDRPGKLLTAEWSGSRLFLLLARMSTLDFSLWRQILRLTAYLEYKLKASMKTLSLFVKHFCTTGAINLKSLDYFLHFSTIIYFNFYDC